MVVLESRFGAILTGKTDSTGRFAAHLAKDSSAHYTARIRRLGYSPSLERIEPTTAGSFSDVIISRVTATDTVKVYAEPLPSKNYRLDAAEISATNRTIAQAFDAVQKLRPEMLGDRARCPKDPVRNVWVNGRRVLFMVGGAPGPGFAIPRVHRSGAGNSDGPTVEAVLRSIKAEHIAEMRYVNCWDTTLLAIGTDNALYIQLKPGFTWDWKNGSHPAP